MKYFNNLINPMNYTYPYTYLPTDQRIDINTKAVRRVQLSIQNSKLKTNVGWLVDNIFLTEILKVTNIFQDISLKEIINIDPTLAEIYFTSIINIQVLSRRYLKIQELFASIGGLFNFFYVVTYLLTRNYINFKYYINFIKSILIKKYY